MTANEFVEAKRLLDKEIRRVFMIPAHLMPDPMSGTSILDSMRAETEHWFRRHRLAVRPDKGFPEDWNSQWFPKDIDRLPPGWRWF